MNSEAKETKKSKRLRFSLGQLLGFMLLIALLISNVLLIQRVRDSERELTQLRREQGKLVVDDPDQMNIIPVPGPQLDWRRNWSWRVYAPPGTKIDICFCNRLIPPDGLPDEKASYIWRNTMDAEDFIGSLPNGKLLSVSLVKRTQNGKTKSYLDFTDGDTIFSYPLEHDVDANRANTTDVAADDGQKTSELGKPLVLLRRRLSIQEEPKPGEASSERIPFQQPLDGFMLWLEPRTGGRSKAL
jgi:hypothetical protein